MIFLIFVGYKDLNIHVYICDDLQIPDILLEDLKPQQQLDSNCYIDRLISLF
jgi:hypothetical protein